MQITYGSERSAWGDLCASAVVARRSGGYAMDQVRMCTVVNFAAAVAAARGGHFGRANTKSAFPPSG